MPNIQPGSFPKGLNGVENSILNCVKQIKHIESSLPSVSAATIRAIYPEKDAPVALETLPSAFPKEAVWELLRHLVTTVKSNISKKDAPLRGMLDEVQTQFISLFNGGTKNEKRQTLVGNKDDVWHHKHGLEILRACRVAYRLAGLAVFY